MSEKYLTREELNEIKISNSLLDLYNPDLSKMYTKEEAVERDGMIACCYERFLVQGIDQDGNGHLQSMIISPGDRFYTKAARVKDLSIGSSWDPAKDAQLNEIKTMQREKEQDPYVIAAMVPGRGGKSYQMHLTREEEGNYHTLGKVKAQEQVQDKDKSQKKSKGREQGMNPTD